MEMLNRLVNKGNTVLIIEHNTEVIKLADYIIDLGPEGGVRGGKVIATGTPEEIKKNQDSGTGMFL
jgi:excinuclease ABC subunit A